MKNNITKAILSGNQKIETLRIQVQVEVNLVEVYKNA